MPERRRSNRETDSGGGRPQSAVEDLRPPAPEDSALVPGGSAMRTTAFLAALASGLAALSLPAGRPEEPAERAWISDIAAATGLARQRGKPLFVVFR